MRYSLRWREFNSLVAELDIGFVTRITNREIMSYGIALVYEGKVLMLQRKCSYALSSILCGRYNNTSLFQYLHEMSADEFENLETTIADSMPILLKSQRDRLNVLRAHITSIKSSISDAVHDTYDELVIPSGGMIHGESMMETALRELCEETGITPDGDHVGTRNVVTIAPHGDIYSNVIFIIKQSEKIDRIKLSNEFTSYRWVGSDDLHLIHSEPLRDIIKTIVS